MTRAEGSDVKSPVFLLVKAFALWKAILLLLVACGQGTGYDTSADLLFELQELRDPPLIAQALPVQSWSSSIVTRLVRWDAIYYVSAAKHGKVYEQEWAFGWGFSKLVNLVTKALPGVAPDMASEAMTAIVISNISHLMSVIILYYLCSGFVFEHGNARRSITVAALHIIAPAGVFLSAPYGESLFATLSFAGYWCFARGLELTRASARTALQGPLFYVLAGTLFGISCTIRSNGIFNGILFAVELARTLISQPRPQQLIQNVPRSAGLVVGGLMVALGSAFPQYLAWLQYCSGEAFSGRRDWCDAIPPSIYTFVQAHYWDVGFLRYYKLSFLPLWLIAAPTLAMMFTSSISRLAHAPKNLLFESSAAPTGQTFLTMLAMPQLVLVTLAATTFHVQVITRVASAYPLMYIWLEELLLNSHHWTVFRKRCNASRLVVVWMVMYGLIQASLYANFLPPA